MSKKSTGIKQLWHNSWVRRSFIIIFTSVAILGTASSCSLPNAFNLNQTNTTTYGVLKSDPAIRQDGFVRANSVIDLNGNTDTRGLTPLSTLKMVRVTKDNLYILTKEKGIFKSEDGAVNWKRSYVFPVGSDNGDANARTREITAQVATNDKFIVSDFAVDILQEKIIYVAGKENSIGKIFQSLDGGETYKEIYSEVERNIGVLFLTVDPINSLRIFAVLDGGALLRSLDGGLTWQKIRSFKDVPVQIGFVPEFGSLLFVLFEKDGLATSRNNGNTWDISPLTKASSEIGENQPKDGLDLTFSNSAKFGRYEKIIPVTATLTYDRETGQVNRPNNPKPWILIADRQMWYSEDAGRDFKKLILPLQSEQLNLYDVAPDPNSGLGQIYASIDNRLFITRNKGQTWNTQDNINLSGTIGNISQIIIDKDNPEIVYVCLVDAKFKRSNGLFQF
jgi:photosystem II stability/assembly factor-like uncharacterized protein